MLCHAVECCGDESPPGCVRASFGVRESREAPTFLQHPAELRDFKHSHSHGTLSDCVPCLTWPCGKTQQARMARFVQHSFHVSRLSGHPPVCVTNRRHNKVVARWTLKETGVGSSGGEFGFNVDLFLDIHVRQRTSCQ